MAQQFSVAVRNARGNQFEGIIGVSAKLSIRSGAPPANCAAADTGTEIIRYSLASDWAAVFAAGAASPWLNNLPLSGPATGAAVPGHYRIYATDGTTCGMQGTVTQTGSGGDLTVDNAAATTVGQTINVTAWALTEAGA
jgi:hypothetical protein